MFKAHSHGALQQPQGPKSQTNAVRLTQIDMIKETVWYKTNFDLELVFMTTVKKTKTKHIYIIHLFEIY